MSNEAIVRRLYDEVANKANHSEADKLIGPDCPLNSNNTLIGRGASSIVLAFGDLRRAWPDLQWNVEEQLAERDSVWTRYSAKYTREGKSQTVMGVSICRVGDGKIMRWDKWDTVPPPKSPSAEPRSPAAEPTDVKTIRAQAQKEVKITKAQAQKDTRTISAQSQKEVAVNDSQSQKEVAVTQAQTEKEVAVTRAQGENEVRAITAQGENEARAINAQRDRETGVIREQLNRPQWLFGLALAGVWILGVLLVGTGLLIAMTRAGELTNGWAIVITAFVAAVVMVAVGVGSIGSRPNIVLGATPPTNTPTPTPTPTPTLTNTSTTSQNSTSIVAQEPAVLTAVAIGALQVLVIAGFPADEATQATIVGGLTALGGILIRGRVSPVQTPVATTK